MRKLTILRRSVQFLFLSLFVYILWSISSSLTGYIIPEKIFHFDPLVMAAVSIAERTVLSGIFFAALIVLLSIVFPRFFCGWVCPLGSMIDLFGSFNKNKIVVSDKFNSIIRKVKFFILLLIMVFAVARIQIVWVFDPLVIAARFISLNFIPAVTASIDSILIYCIRTFSLYESFVYDLYGVLRMHFLGVKTIYFNNALFILLLFVFIAAVNIFIPRFWCRVICPLGGFYAVFGKIGLLERKVEGCNNCGACRKNCRMDAIKSGSDYIKSECVLCMDCVYDCPAKGTSFRFGFPGSEKNRGENARRGAADDEDNKETGISRRSFLVVLLGGIMSMGFRFSRMPAGKPMFIRPPGSLDEDSFLNRCIRCGNCMRVCPTNVLQPVLFEGTFHDIWTPHLVADIGYCEYNCNQCTTVCPTGAIRKISIKEKQKTKIASAKVKRSACLVWAHGQNCLVCEEHCPVPNKAIKIIEENSERGNLKKPAVDNDLCIGCGICQNKCPVRPGRAIRISRQAF